MVESYSGSVAAGLRIAASRSLAARQPRRSMERDSIFVGVRTSLQAGQRRASGRTLCSQ